MAGPGTTRNNLVLLVLLLFGQLVLMAGSVRGSEGSTTLESWTMDLSGPVIRMAQLAGGGIHGAFAGARQLLDAHSRNAALEDEVERLRSEVARQREAGLENIRLRRLLAMRDALAPRSIGASVVSSVHSGQDRLLVLDRGSQDGVQVDQAVVAWGGAVGKIVEVGRSHSKVRLLSDPNSGIAGIVQRSRAKGMVLGDGSENLQFLYVPRLSDVIYTDRVVSSGLDGIFPRGFGIGNVVGIRERADGSREIELMPDLDYRSLEEVLVLLEPVVGEVLAPLEEPPS